MIGWHGLIDLLIMVMAEQKKHNQLVNKSYSKRVFDIYMNHGGLK